MRARQAIEAYRKRAGGYFDRRLQARALRAVQRAEWALLKVPPSFHRAIIGKLAAAFDGADTLPEAWARFEAAAQSFSGFGGPAQLPMAAGDDAIEAAARDYSQRIGCMVHRVLAELEHAGEVTTEERRIAEMVRLYRDCAGATRMARIEPPELPSRAEGLALERAAAAAIRRMMCARWWTRQVRRAHARWVEQVAQRNGFVGRNVGSPYVSGAGLERYRAMRRRNRGILAGLDAVMLDANGNEAARIPLEKCIDASPANPANRRNEMMLRVRGLEEFANEHGWHAAMWTVTCPSRFHRWTEDAGGKVRQNPNWRGATPREGQIHLRNVWARARAELARRGITLAGMRVAEPHHDGCPHWHMLVFAPAEELAEAEAVMRERALADSPDEPGADVRRFRADPIDPEKGSAAAYVAKYIAKHVDAGGTSMEGQRDYESGMLIGMDEQPMPGERPESLDRVLAWASIWGIRQFQFFRAGSVTAWREVRRLNKTDAKGPIAAAWQAANAENYGAMGRADFRAFLRAVEREPVRLIVDTSREGEYGEPVRRIVGIECGGRVYLTHENEWRIERRPREAAAGAISGAWTCDNNYTGGGKRKTAAGPPKPR